ncbi:MAG: Crp/Fnr family transcriptional regulator [Leptolyngbyaceae cyanobacterium RM1_406_9]|nr:Crp/Fnr family transcriptional regulator [Leptolyngbyaceae cyanobacterium RM1_406_9]
MTSLTLNSLLDTLTATLTRRIFTAKELLLQQGEPANYLYWVKSGRIRLVSFVNHQMVTHYFVEAGELFGESALYIPTYGCSAIAETISEVIAIPVEDFATALKEHSSLAETYLATLTHRLYAVKSLLELRSISNGYGRLLHYLTNQLEPGRDTVILNKSLRDIASELALTPEALSRLLSRLQREGVINRKKRSITFSQDWLEDVFNY